MQFKNPEFIVLMMFIIGGIYFTSCKNKGTTIVEDEIPLYDTKEFRAFYDRFGTDSVYQMQHIVFPLQGIKALTDSLDRPDPNFKWQESTWKIHGAFDDMNGLFGREFISMKGIVIEKITDKSGTFSMERRFGHLSSGWNLIYYREMGKY